MNNQCSEFKSIYVVVENLGLYKKLYPKLTQRFNVATQRLEYKAVSKKRFDKKTRIFTELRNFLNLFFRMGSYSKYDSIVCFARKRHLSYLVFARIMKGFGVDMKLFLYGFYIQSWTMNPIMRYFLSIVLTENIGMLVISKTDLEFLKSLSQKVVVGYYPFCLAQRPADQLEIVELGNYVFSGGHTNRDYDTVLVCAENMPQIRFVIVCSQYTKIQHAMPANVEVYMDLQGPAFYNLLAKSRVVVIPLLQRGFSSGQTVATESMQSGKVTIYCNYENVSQYFDDGINGIQYVSGDAGSLEDAIKKVFYDEDRLTRIGQLAREKYNKFYTKVKLDDAIVENIDSFLKSA